VEGDEVSVERADLEAKLKEIQEVVDETKDSARTIGIAAVVGVVLLLLLVYVLGRRKGRKGSARVEVFRLG
jgi:hypothetical protein